jgi:orotate phosphoribosyltransferase-like protein
MTTFRSGQRPVMVRRGPESDAADRVLALLRLGYTRGQIAEEMDVNANVVRRLIRRECLRRNTNVEGLRNLRVDEEAPAA